MQHVNKLNLPRAAMHAPSSQTHVMTWNGKVNTLEGLPARLDRKLDRPNDTNELSALSTMAGATCDVEA